MVVLGQSLNPSPLRLSCPVGRTGPWFCFEGRGSSVQLLFLCLSVLNWSFILVYCLEQSSNGEGSAARQIEQVCSFVLGNKVDPFNVFCVFQS